MDRAEHIIDVKKQTYHQIQDMALKWNGTTIGITPERGIQMFTAIYPAIHAKYPDTTFQPIESDVDSMVRMMEANKLDISFQTIYERKYKQLSYTNIFTEPFYLCIPKTHPLAYKETLTPDHYPEISLTRFQGDLFTLVKKTSTMRTVIDRLFESAGFKPKLLFESTSKVKLQYLQALISLECTPTKCLYRQGATNVAPCYRI